jgi:hypothetical protein
MSMAMTTSPSTVNQEPWETQEIGAQTAARNMTNTKVELLTSVSAQPAVAMKGTEKMASFMGDA